MTYVNTGLVPQLYGDKTFFPGEHIPDDVIPAEGFDHLVSMGLITRLPEQAAEPTAVEHTTVEAKHAVSSDDGDPDEQDDDEGVEDDDDEPESKPASRHARRSRPTRSKP